MKKKVCIVTTTRADYGLLYPIIARLNKEKNINLTLLVSGTHLLASFGMTINEIVEDGYKSLINEVPIITDEDDSPCEILSKTVLNFERELSKINPDCVVVLGDRFEILGVASVCTLLNIPLVHISGGDITMGAIDDACRHAITKMANLHFVGNEKMAKRVVQMGEQPSTVFNVGEPGVENILHSKLQTFNEFKESIGWGDLKKSQYILFTYHPETLSNQSVLEQIKVLINFVKKHNEFQYIITKSNIDNGGQKINEYIKTAVKGYNNIKFIDSLGKKRYLSAVKYSMLVMGNSSSGIVEVPYLCVPTLNIGNRQQGREQGKSIVNSDLTEKNLALALKKCIDENFRKECKCPEFIYGDGNTSSKIVQVLTDMLNNNKFSKKKEFFEEK